MLWTEASLSVRDIWQKLPRDKSPGSINSVLKRVQIMEEKGLIVRNGEARHLRYSPAAPQSSTETTLVKDIVSRVFGGSAFRLMLQALNANGRKLSSEEVSRIQKKLAGLHKGK